MTRQLVLAMALGFACAALAGTVAQAGPSEQAKLKQQLVDLEKRSWEAWKARDGKFFDGFLSDDHVEVGMYGRAGKSDIVDFVGSPACVVQDYVIDDFDLTVLDDSPPKGVRRPQGATLRPFASGDLSFASYPAPGGACGKIADARGRCPPCRNLLSRGRCRGRRGPLQGHPGIPL